MMNIFVAKLDFGVSSDQLRQEFERFGKVNKATVALDRETGKSRGFAFVEMANREDGTAAINGLDGKTFNGRPCAVKEADPRPDNRAPRDQSNRPFNSAPRRDDSAPKPSIAPAAEGAVEFPLNTELRKKSKEKDKKGKSDWDSDGGPKKVKPASFKSKPKFNDFDDEDDDDDLNLLKLRRELEKEDFEDDEDDDF
jgi:RNA recognition motif-containing protein